MRRSTVLTETELLGDLISAPRAPSPRAEPAHGRVPAPHGRTFRWSAPRLPSPASSDHGARCVCRRESSPPTRQRSLEAPTPTGRPPRAQLRGRLPAGAQLRILGRRLERGSPAPRGIPSALPLHRQPHDLADPVGRLAQRLVEQVRVSLRSRLAAWPSNAPMIGSEKPMLASKLACQCRKSWTCRSLILASASISCHALRKPVVEPGERRERLLGLDRRSSATASGDSGSRCDRLCSCCCSAWSRRRPPSRRQTSACSRLRRVGAGQAAGTSRTCWPSLPLVQHSTSRCSSPFCGKRSRRCSRFMRDAGAPGCRVIGQSSRFSAQLRHRPDRRDRSDSP